MNRFLVLIFLLVFNFGYSQLSFQDSSVSAGVAVSYGTSTYGGGVSFCDFNGDGWDDITYSTTDGEEVYFYQNNTDGTFSLVDLGINDKYRTKQVIWIDYDNDGDKDFFATSISGLNKFYSNDGSMNFTDITDTCGLFTSNLYTYGASFGDIDKDGDLDVFISNRDDVTFNQYSYLYENVNGTFVEITSEAGIFLGNQLSFCSVFFDYDNDGDQDIYVANDKLANINRLYSNNGDNTFDDVSASSGSGIAIDAMSTTIGDYNNDGWFDIYVTNTTGGNNHLRNNGDGTFTNVAAGIGTGFYSIGWGSVFLDADNDSDLDLYVSSSMDGSVPDRLTSAFYNNQGDDTFIIPENIGFENDSRKSFSNAIGDFNNDGLPDIIVMNDVENNFLWENTSVNSNNWLKIKLQGFIGNKDGIGSKIEVTTGTKKQYRYTINGEGYIGQNSNSEFIGLGAATNIDEIKITWLSGTVDILTNVTPNQSLTISEGQTLSVKNENNIDFNIYPNPVKNKLQIQLNNELRNDFKNVEVFNLLGKKVLSKTFKNTNFEVDLSDISQGMYIVKISIGSKFISKKVLVE